MKKILVFGMTQNPGGVESFIMNYYRRIDKNRFCFSFLCNFMEKCAYEDELTAGGSSVYHIAARSENYMLYKRQMKAFFKEHEGCYDVIWVNVSSLANIDYLVYAKKYGIPKRIIHSHNSCNMDSRLRGVLHKINRSRISKFANMYFACSKSAADFFYNRKLRGSVKLIHNAIDLKRVSFSDGKRKELRQELGIGDSLVIGNVGRLHFQKNQGFLLEVMSELIKLEKDAKLIIAGQGPDEAMLKKKAQQLGISNSVYFVGVQSDMQKYLSAFDVFVFPSLFEGLSIAALEAQANGLLVVASHGIHKDTKLLSSFTFIGLEQPAEKWAEIIVKKAKAGAYGKRTDEETVKQSFDEKGYNIETEVKKLEEMF